MKPGHRRTSIWMLGASSLGLLLASCDGGGGGNPAPAPTPTSPPNQAPTITSANAVAVPENQTAPFYNLTANDPEGSPVTFAITGGADAARFSLDNRGALSFRAAPDYEAPDDANHDGVYVVEITASDGQATSSPFVLTITLTDDPGGPFSARQVGTGFVEPNNLVGIPDGSGRVLVTERRGLVRIVNPATASVAAMPFLDLTASVSTTGKRGLLGFALAPDFATSGIFYVMLNTPTNQFELRRYTTVAGNRDRGDPASGSVVLSFPFPATWWLGGWIGFGPDNMLYVTIGSGDTAGTEPLRGKVLRIDPRTDAFPADAARNYAIPADNPLPAGLPAETWAAGFLDPRRTSVDPFNGTVWVGSSGVRFGRGYADQESDVDMIRRQDAGGVWVGRPGRLAGGPPPVLGPGQYTSIFHTFAGISMFTGWDLSGGLVYRGPIEALQGRYIFGFLDSSDGGYIRSIRAAAVVQNQLAAVTYPTGFGETGPVVAFGEDEIRNLYVLYASGNIFKIEP